MIPKIGFELSKRSCLQQKNKKKYSSQPTKEYSGQVAYYMPFSGKKDKLNGTSKLDTLMFYTDTPAKKIINELKEEAKISGYGEITSLHVVRHSLVSAKNYIEDLNNGVKDYDMDLRPDSVTIFTEDVTSDMFSSPKSRTQVLPIINEQITILDSILEANKPKNVSNKDIQLSDELVDSIWDVREEKETVTPYLLYDGAFSSNDTTAVNYCRNLNLALKKKLMINNAIPRMVFSDYEPKVQNIIKNISLGNHMFITYDAAKDTPNSFIETLKHSLKSKSDKYDVTELNASADTGYFSAIVNILSKDKTKDHIIIANPGFMLLNDEDTSDNAPFDLDFMSDDVKKLISKPPANIKYIFYDTRDNFYSGQSDSSNLYNDFEEASIPSLNTKQMIQFFKAFPFLLSELQVPFSKKALEKTVEASSQLDGAFPNKSIQLMKKIVAYYIDKKEINEADVANYIKEVSNIFKKDSDDSSIDVIFDTGKKIKNMVGKSSTQKEALGIVKQIKSNKLGTKGIILYSQDGSAGSGRRYTAKAIAGDARVPYIEMNAVDFGTKDVDLFGGGALSPEKAVKKLFTMVKTQAEANANRAAVLFIENFEYFTLGEMVSFYHQKAMAQLLREMEKADRDGLNILVAGSVSDPGLIGEATMKSFKFVDTLEVASPAFSKEERFNVLTHAFKENKIKLERSSEKSIISYASEITEYFSFIMLKNFVKKIQSVAQERGHKFVTKSDLTEAYLQLTTGRPSLNKIEPHEKEIVASHECGHAVNLEVMNNLAKTYGKPWHIPSKVNFITLDPRGLYGGAVYHGDDNNHEVSFEALFSDIVCSFGGNSAESRFYGMDGSYGISSDMDSVRKCSEIMVKVMGLGYNTGKMSIFDSEELSDKMKSMIEEDERVIINNARITSELITEVYEDFNKWFTENYSKLVGTGECLVDGDEFRSLLNQWKEKQPPEVQQKLEACDKTIIQIMEATKKGIAVMKKS